MKYLWVLAVLSFCVLHCSSTPSDALKGTEDRTPQMYSEDHIDFKGWKRSKDCCVAYGERGGVASGGTYSSRAGNDVLKEGGNAIDAAVATAFALAVERPHSAGLGGGGFMTVHLAGKGRKPAEEKFVDFRETAPRKATRDMYLDDKGNIVANLSTEGPLAIATPSFVQGLYAIHKRWGKLKWNRVLEPAAKLAEQGFPVYLSLAKRIEKDANCLKKEAGIKAAFFNGETPLKEGDRLIQADLGKTLREIQKKGEAPFRSGAIAKQISEHVLKSGGILQLEDLRKYEVKFREPIRSTFKDYSFISAPPPSAGGILISEILNILENYDVAELAKKPENYLHVMAESMRYAYADRSLFIGDPDFTKTDFAALLKKEYADRIQHQIELTKATPSESIKPGALVLPVSKSTTHLSVYDEAGNAVASTLTINDSFGSCVVAPGTGVFLNNEMDDFSAKPGTANTYGLTGGEANSIAPLKRPVSSMSPTIVFRNEKPVLVVGGAGGSRIITGTLQVMLNDLVLYKGNLRRSVFAPRIHHQWLPDKLDMEQGFPKEISSSLEKRGHKISEPDWDPILQAVAIDGNGDVSAVFDPRDEGGAEAY